MVKGLNETLTEEQAVRQFGELVVIRVKPKSRVRYPAMGHIADDPKHSIVSTDDEARLEVAMRSVV